MIPGTVEFENFDEGAEGVAYHDIEAANDPARIDYRKTGVDLEITPDKKIILVGHIKEGEWLKYTVDVAKSGVYELELGVAVRGVDPPEIRLEFDGVDVSGPIQLTTTTQRWYLFTQILGPTVNLEGGSHVMRVVVVKSPKGTSLNLDYVRFVAKREPKKTAGSMLGAEEPEPTRALRGLKHSYFPFASVRDATGWKLRHAEIQRRVLVAAGLYPLPEKIPLNAVIHGRIEKEDYTVEKVTFKSLPGHFVTGNLYLPKQITGKIPAVICPHGHWPKGRFMKETDAE